MEGTILRIDGADVWAEEDVATRSAHAKHYRLPDGRHCAILQQGQHFLARDTGTWEPCDHTVTAEARDGFSHAVNRAPLRARFGPDGRVRQGFGVGLYLTTAPVTPPGMPVQPLVDGNRVTYVDPWPFADLVYEHGGHRVKESIVLRSPLAPASFTFRVAETGGASLAPNVDGGIDVLDQGATLGRMLAPFCVDAAGERGGAALTYDGTTLTVTPDAAWLADPARVFPVVVDPTTTIQPDATAGKDSYLKSTSPTSNYGTDTALWSGQGWSTPYSIYRPVIQFDLSSIPAAAIISAATLSLYCYAEESTSNINHSTHKLLAAWTESGVTWSSRDGTNNWATAGGDVGSAEATTTITGPGAWFSWSLQSLAQAWLDGSSANYGVLVKGPESSESTKTFYSSDDATALTRPKLIVTYNTPPAATVTSPNGTNASPTQYTDQVSGMILSGGYTDPDSHASGAKQHQIHDEAGNLIWDSGEVTDSTASGGTVTAAVPAGYLKYSVKYRWRWRAKDSDANPLWSAWTANGTGDGCWFLCTLTAPTGPSATFTRASTAYKSDGTEVASGVPRYEAGVFGNGLRVEEGQVSPGTLLTANQASVETNLTGFGTWQSTIARVTSEAWHGTVSLAMTLTASDGTTSTSIALSSPTVGTPYAESVRMKGPVGKQVKLLMRFEGGANPYSDTYSGTLTCDGTWQKLTVSANVDYSDRTTLVIAPWGTGVSGDVFYADGLQIEQKAYATSWQLPGTARAAESAYIDHAALPATWAFEAIYKPDHASTVAYSVHRRMALVYVNTDNYYELAVGTNNRVSLTRKSGGAISALSSAILTWSAGDEIRILCAHESTGKRVSVKVGAGAVAHVTDTDTTHPVGSVTRTYLGSFSDGIAFANGLIDDAGLFDVVKLESLDGVTFNNAQVEAWLGRTAALPAYGAEIFRLTLDGHLESGLAKPDKPNAEIDLAWAAHAGENLAGYNVYQSADAGATWAKINTALVTGTSYADRYVKSGTAMQYKISAVATDGYESAYSTTASATVTITATWLNAKKVDLQGPLMDGVTAGRLASHEMTLDGTWDITDEGWADDELSIAVAYRGISERDEIKALFAAGAVVYIRNEEGDRFRGKVVSQGRIREPWNGSGFLSVTLAEVTPA